MGNHASQNTEIEYNMLDGTSVHYKLKEIKESSNYPKTPNRHLVNS